MCRKDRKCFGRGLCIYVKENIASKQLSLHLDKETEAMYLEINKRLRKCLIVGLYKPPSQKNFLFLENISKNLLRYLDSYENITLLRDFNRTILIFEAWDEKAPFLLEKLCFLKYKQFLWSFGFLKYSKIFLLRKCNTFLGGFSFLKFNKIFNIKVKKKFISKNIGFF